MKMPRNWMLWGVSILALVGCRRSLDLDGGSAPAQSAELPTQVGGLTPVDGSHLADGAFGVEGVAASNSFADSLPICTIADHELRVVMAGVNGYPAGIRVERLDATGQPDETFGQAGVSVFSDFEFGVPAWGASSPALHEDRAGRLWIAFSLTLVSNGEDVAIVSRLFEDGSLDTQFGLHGLVVIDLSASLSETRAVDLLDDSVGGVFLCASEALAAGTNVHVVQIDGEGELDPDFGEGGVATIHENEPAMAAAATLDSEGRVVVCGSIAPHDIAVWRFDVSGKADTGFGDAGRVRLGGGSTGESFERRGVDIAVDSQDRVLVLGDRSTDLDEIDDWPSQLVQFGDLPTPVFDVELHRLLADGSLDTDFGSNGRFDLAFNSGPYYPVSGGSMGGDHMDAAAGLFVDPATDLIHVSGWSDPPMWETAIGWAYFGPTRPFIARLTPSGELDTNLSGAGHVLLGWNTAGGGVAHLLGLSSCLARDAQGRWLVSGRMPNGSHRVRRVILDQAP